VLAYKGEGSGGKMRGTGGNFIEQGVKG